MKRFISAIIIIVFAASAFCISFISNAREKVTVSFYPNNTSSSGGTAALSIPEGETLGSYYDVPDVGEGFVFKGWYYGRGEDAKAVDFANDTFSSDTDIYAHWASVGVVSPDENDENRDNLGVYDGFDLAGVQIKTGAANDVKNGGLRFVASLSNNLLKELDALSDSTTENNNRVEYGFIAAKKDSVNDWVSFAESNGIDMSYYTLEYNGENVNGVDTTARQKSYQGFVSNLDCTASDYSASDVRDYKKYDKYRLYSLAVTYSDGAEHADTDIVVRAYLRYYDANGLLRTIYDNYNGTSSFGGLSTSYTSIQNQSVTVGYYSSVSAMTADANNLTTANANSDRAGAACSMYISGSRVYASLLKNSALDEALNFAQRTDFNLNGYILDAGDYNITSNSEFSMYNGTCRAGSGAQRFSEHNGSLTKLSRVKYEALSLVTENTFKGVFVTSGNVYLTDCAFNVNVKSGDSFCKVNVFDNSEHAFVSGCVYNVRTAVINNHAVYNLNTDLSVKDSSFTIEQTADKTNASALAVESRSSDNTVITKTDVTMAGDYGNACAVMVRSTNSNDVTPRCFYADGLTVTMNIDDLYNTSSSDERSFVRGLSVGQDAIAMINNYKADIKVKESVFASVYGMYLNRNADVTASGVDIDIERTTGQEKAYALYGIITFGTSKLLLKSADIRVPCVLEKEAGIEHNLGVSATDYSTVTIDPESDDDVFVQGGNAALNSFADANYIITGGKFCSPTHGGAYLGGNAKITGGEFYSYRQSGHNENGAFYVTLNAVVNISNAQIYSSGNGHSRAIVTRDNYGVSGSPVVNVTNTSLTGGAYGIDCTTGTVYLHSGVVIKAVAEYTGNVFDNR